MSMFSTSFGFRQPYQVLGAYEPLCSRYSSLSRTLSRLYDVRNGCIVENGLHYTTAVRTRGIRETE
jgi:hypothetical protein